MSSSSQEKSSVPVLGIEGAAARSPDLNSPVLRACHGVGGDGISSPMVLLKPDRLASLPSRVTLGLNQIQGHHH